MIIVKLQGGIGNQFFQYALGRQLSELNGSVIKLDITSFKQDPFQREFSLEKYATKINIANIHEINLLRSQPQHVFIRIARMALKLGPKSTSTHILEKNRKFDPKILNLKDNVYLEGYWQSEKYFSGVANNIRKELQLKKPIPSEYQKSAEKIRSTKAVSLHIRRGDYISNPAVRLKHGYCSDNYYQKSIEFICSIIPDATFFIFSDEIEWVKINFRINQPSEFVSLQEHNDPHEELRLMSLCQHNIIANSSFSWWAAWLNGNSDKLVLAPRQWLQRSIDTPDIIPKSWVKI